MTILSLTNRWIAPPPPFLKEGGKVRVSTVRRSTNIFPNREGTVSRKVYIKKKKSLQKKKREKVFRLRTLVPEKEEKGKKWSTITQTPRKASSVSKGGIPAIRERERPT